MGNLRKSACQLRLEARSREYSARREHVTPYSKQPPSKSSLVATPPSSAHDAAAAHLALKLEERIARATESRIQSQCERRALARERVQRAQRVAREQHAKRREAQNQCRSLTSRRLEVARARRREQLERLQQVCKQRLEQVHEKVESVREVQRWREERQRRQLEHQMVDAARRREEQTQRMVRRLSERWQCVESVKDRVQRAKFIQRWYRRNVETRRNAQSLQGVKKDVARLVEGWMQLEKAPFEQSMQVLQNRELARAAQHVLKVLLPSAVNGSLSPRTSPQASPQPSPSKDSQQRSPRSTRPANASFRVLLMAGMIAFHPHEIMEESPCPRLAFASRFLLQDMQQIRTHLDGFTSAAELKRAVAILEARFAFYFESFSAWKEQDAERLATEISRSYQDIYATKLHYAAVPVDHEGDGMHQLRHQTEKQLVQLRNALARVVGREEANSRLAEVEASVQSNRSKDDQTAQGSRVTESEDVFMLDVATEANPNEQERVEGERNDTHPRHDIGASPMLQDEKLVHELILNPQFRFPSSFEADDVAGQVRRAMVDAFWKRMAQTKDVSLILQQIDELRGLFVEALRPQARFVHRIERVLSLEKWQRALADAHENFQHVLELCSELMDMILQIEAPARNATTRAFQGQVLSRFNNLSSSEDPEQESISVLVDILAFSVKKTEELRVDISNFHLELLAAYLEREGTDYERKKLKEKLSSGEVSLKLTKKWLEYELHQLLPGLSESAKSRLRSGDGSSYESVVHRAILSAVMEHIEGKTEIFPESLHLDMAHLRRIRDEMDRVTIIASMLVVFHDFAARYRPGSLRETVAKLSKDLSVLLKSSGITGSQLITHVAAAGKSLCGASEEDCNVLEQRLSSLLQPDNPIYRLLFSRVGSAISSIVVDNAHEMAIHPSLDPFLSDLKPTAAFLLRLARHNASVYSIEYNAIIRNLVTNHL